MKNLSTILSVIALIGVIVLGIMFNKKTAPAAPSAPAVDASGKSVAMANVAYIDIDTFEANYTLLKDKKAEFSKKQNNMEAELQRSAEQLQSDALAYQKKAQTMSDVERGATEKRLGQMQQSLQTRKQSMEEQFVKEQEVFNKDLHNQLDSFLEEYNNVHHYDYILSYSRTNPQIMYANKRLNITPDVIKGMNERAGTTKAK